MWSRDQFLESPGQTYIQRGNTKRTKVSPFKCCYFSIDAYHDYYLQRWTKMDNRTVLNKPDLICIRYSNMRIFPSDFIHGSGFKNIISDGNFRIQLLIIDDGHKLYHPLKKTLITIMLMSQMKSCYVIILEKKNEDDDSNYNNSSVRNYTYSSFKPIEFCPVKKRTGVYLS